MIYNNRDNVLFIIAIMYYLDVLLQSRYCIAGYKYIIIATMYAAGMILYYHDHILLGDIIFSR